MDFAAIILAGGKGTRLGEDKPFLLFRGKPLLLHQIEALRKLGLSEIVVALGEKRPFPMDLGVQVVEDKFNQKGPLAGIHAGLTAISAPAALVLACDMPFLVPDLIHKLFHLSQAKKIAICLRKGYIEPFPGVYPKLLIPLLEEILRGKNWGVQKFIQSAPHAFLPEEKVCELDPEGLSFVNINTMAEAKELLCEP